MQRRNSLGDEVMFRVGTAMLGMFAGAAIGVLTYLPLAALGTAAPVGRFLAATTLSGLLCGALMPYVAATAFQGLMHFFAGMLAAIAGDGWPASEEAPRWLRAASWLGVFYTVGVWLFLDVAWRLSRHG